MTASELLCVPDSLTWLRARESCSVDAIITDPPYGLGYIYAGRREDYKTAAHYGPWIQEVFKECKRIVTYDGWIVMRLAHVYLRNFYTWFDLGKFEGVELGTLAKDPVPDKGFVVRHCTDPLLIWYNRSRRRPGRGPGVPNVYYADLSESIRNKPQGAHPYPFPEDAAAQLIANFSRPGDLVLDPFVGSGMILLAAARAGRRYLGLDREPSYVQLATTILATAGVTDVRDADPAALQRRAIDRATQQLAPVAATAPASDTLVGRAPSEAVEAQRRVDSSARQGRGDPLRERRAPPLLQRGQPGRAHGVAPQSPAPAAARRTPPTVRIVIGGRRPYCYRITLGEPRRVSG